MTWIFFIPIVSLPDVYDVMQKILDILQRSTIAHREIADPRQRFWTIYRTAAEEFDNEFLKKYDGDMDTSMIFVSALFFRLSSTIH